MLRGLKHVMQFRGDLESIDGFLSDQPEWASALSELKIGVVSHSRAGGNPDRGTGFPPARE